jgi:hypothetical protein
MTLAFDLQSFCNALQLSDGVRVLIGPTKSLQSGVIEILAPESQITGNVAVLDRDSRKQSVDWRAMWRMVE